MIQIRHLAQLLANEVESGEVIARLERGGIETLLLKGPTIDRWLYSANEPRGYGDVDVLVAPHALERAERTLRGLGYSNRYDGPAPTFAEEHADNWISESKALAVDLHRRLWGFRAPPRVVWDRLWENRVAMIVGGQTVQALGEPARALALALHAAHHGPDVPKSMLDLQRGLDRLPSSVWQDALALATALDAAEGLSAGLGLCDSGCAVRDRLGLPVASREPFVVAASLWSMPAMTEGLLRLEETRGARGKLKLLLGEAVPSANFMRTRSVHAEMARSGHFGLQRAYAHRWLAMVRHLPRALVAARQYRKRRANQTP